MLSEPATQQPAEDGADRAAAVEPGPIASLANKEQLAPGGQSRGANAAGLALVVQLVDRLWLGASGSDEKRRMLIVLGVGFMLGTLFGLVF